MHLALKLAPVIVALVLSACGGGGSEAPAPGAPVTLIAGVAKPVSYAPEDKKPGCVDGAALGAKMAAKSSWAFARPANGDLLFVDLGYCDSRYRIRVINPAGNTIKTLAVGARRQNDPEALTTFLTPTSIAVAPSGDIYIGDSNVFSMNGVSVVSRSIPGRGPGIWKLSSDGNISVLAGVRLPMTASVDGVGAAASFQYIEAMCYGSDGLLYINDYGRLRTINASGTVTTATNSGGVVVQSLVACGIDGSVLVSRRFNNSANDDFYDPIAQKSIAKVSASGLNVFPLDNFLQTYFGSDNPSVLVRVRGFGSDPYSDQLIIVNLVDGSFEIVAKVSWPIDLTATPPVIDTAIAGVATGDMNFDILTQQSVIRFTRKP